jgi:hypothetical protein
MTNLEDLPPDTREHLVKIADLARDMTPEDRYTAASMFHGVMGSCAAFGSDETIPAALILMELNQLLLLAAKAERRETEVG